MVAEGFIWRRRIRDEALSHVVMKLQMTARVHQILWYLRSTSAVTDRLYQFEVRLIQLRNC